MYLMVYILATILKKIQKNLKTKKNWTYSFLCKLFYTLDAYSFFSKNKHKIRWKDVLFRLIEIKRKKCKFLFVWINKRIENKNMVIIAKMFIQTKKSNLI